MMAMLPVSVAKRVNRLRGDDGDLGPAGRAAGPCAHTVSGHRAPGRPSLVWVVNGICAGMAKWTGRPARGGPSQGLAQQQRARQRAEKRASRLGRPSPCPLPLPLPSPSSSIVLAPIPFPRRARSPIFQFLRKPLMSCSVSDRPAATSSSRSSQPPARSAATARLLSALVASIIFRFREVIRLISVAAKLNWPRG